MSTLSTLATIRVLISLAAAAERCASERTSLATTANPRPCSPARAASTAAFSARMFVWKAMPSITPMMSPIFLDDAAMSFIVSTTRPTAMPPRPAAAEASVASWLAVPAVSAFERTLPVSCSIAAAVCCRLLACSSVRWLRSVLPVAISADPVAMLSLDSRTWPTTSARRSRMRRIAARMLVVSPSRVFTATPRLPCAIALAMATTSPGSAPSCRTRPRVIVTAIVLAATTASAARISVTTIALWPSSRAARPSLVMMAVCSLVMSAMAAKNARCDGRIVTSSVCAASSYWLALTRRSTSSRSL